jgi:peptidoglycan hydrolase-like protein with peptidoglycan-binding domain
MKTIRTLAVSAALIALTMGPALAEETKAAAPATTTKTEAKPKSTTKHTAWTKDQIKAAQAGIAKGGYYKGTVDGVWNKSTESALKAWQKANKMPVSEHLTQEELTKLQAA